MRFSAFRKDILREIKKSFFRFLSIALIVGLGVGFFAGMKATEPTMLYTAKDYFDSKHLMDFEVLSITGFSEDDVNAVRNIEGIEDVTGSYYIDVPGKTSEETNNHAIRVFALPEEGQPNQIQLLEGRMPENKYECVICQTSIGGKEYELNEIIALSGKTGTTQVDTVLQHTVFKVVGIVKSPMYFSYSYGSTSVGDGNIYAFIYVPKDNFLYTRFTVLYATVGNKNYPLFSAEYNSYRDGIAEEIKKTGEAQQADYLASLNHDVDASQEELIQQQQESEEQLNSAMEELNQAKTSLDESLKKIQNGWTNLQSESGNGRAELSKQEQELAVARNQLIDYEQKLADSERDYNTFSSSMRDSRLQLNQSEAEYQAGKKEYDNAMSALQSSKRELESSYASLNQAQKQYDNSATEYSQQLQQYKSLESQVSSLEALRSELANADSRISDQKASLDAAWDAYYRGEGDYTEEELNSMQSQWESESAVNEQRKAYYQSALSDLGVSDPSEMRVTLSATKETLDGISQQLNVSKKELDDQWSLYRSGQEKYEYQLNQLTPVKTQLDASRKELDDAKVQYEKGMIELANAELSLEEGREQIQQYRSQLAEGEEKLEAARTKMDQELAKGESELNEAQSKYDISYKEFEQGLSDYEIQKDKVDRELRDASAEIQNARGNIIELSKEGWYVLNRDDILENYTNMGNDTDRLDSLAGLFPIFFLLVAVLVCVTTMGRMVEEQRSQIGTYKALGLSKKIIFSKYIFFALLTSVIGGVAGEAICINVFPRVIMAAYKGLYDLPEPTLSIPWDMAVLSLGAGVLCTVLVTYFCCRSTIREFASVLMHPRVPRAGHKIFLERITFLWNRLPFTAKVTLRNIVRYKLRTIMTIIGVMGCTALIVSGFGLQNAISPIVRLQYEELSDFDGYISLYESCDRDMAEIYKQELYDATDMKLVMLEKEDAIKVSFADREMAENCFLLVPENEDDFSQLYRMQNPDTKELYALPTEGVLISQKMADVLGIELGDTISFNYDEKEYQIDVAGIVENYVYHYIYMSPEVFEDLTHTTYTGNMFVISSESGAFTSREILDVDEDFLSVIKTSSLVRMMDESLSSMNMVILVMIFTAFILALIVLYNLTSINISERTREIATMKVLGASKRGTRMHVFRENIVLTILGTGCGCIGGYFLAQYMIQTIETQMVMFSKHISITSYVYACLISFGITILVMLMTRRRIWKIDMVTSLKAVE